MNLPQGVFVIALSLCAGAAWAADGLFVDSNTVRQVQESLSDRGYRTGAADGRMGPQTQAAVRRFQRAEKLVPTGQLNRQTLIALGLEKGGGVATEDEPRFERATVRRVQRTLNNRGFHAGPSNGVMTPRTRAALEEFQKSENLEVNGTLNSRTLAALGVAEESASVGSSRPLVLSYSNGTIRAVQHELQRRGYRLGAADGVLGGATRAALRDFQRAQDLSVNGRPDNETLAALGLEREVIGAARR